MLIKCTTCSFQKIEKVAGFQSSNYTHHYKNKHPFITYNKDSEKTRQKRSNLVKKTDTISDSSDKSDFFNRKRLRTATITDFDQNEAYNKILNFIVSNNLSFNILESDLFKDLLNYYNKSSPVINRYKIRLILDKTF